MKKRKFTEEPGAETVLRWKVSKDEETGERNCR